MKFPQKMSVVLLAGLVFLPKLSLGGDDRSAFLEAVDADKAVQASANFGSVISNVRKGFKDARLKESDIRKEFMKAVTAVAEANAVALEQQVRELSDAEVSKALTDLRAGAKKQGNTVLLAKIQSLETDAAKTPKAKLIALVQKDAKDGFVKFFEKKLEGKTVDQALEDLSKTVNSKNVFEDTKTWVDNHGITKTVTGNARFDGNPGRPSDWPSNVGLAIVGAFTTALDIVIVYPTSFLVHLIGAVLGCK